MLFCPGAAILINQLPTARIFIWPSPEILSLQPCDLHVTAAPLLNGVSSFEGVEMDTAVCSTFIALTRCHRLPIICPHTTNLFIMAEFYWSQSSTMSCSITSSCDLLNDPHHKPTGLIFLDIYFKTNQCLALFVDVCISRHIGTFSWHVPQESEAVFPGFKTYLRRVILIKACLLNLPALSEWGR